MQRFFSSFSDIDSFTHSLKLFSSDNACLHCKQNDQWVSHGKIKQQANSLKPTLIGKRIFCSNRYNKTGCGRTRQLYVSTAIPHKHYSTAQVLEFITHLLAGCWVEEAYRNAVGECDARQAWRWLRSLQTKLGNFRLMIKRPLLKDQPSFPNRTPRLQHLLPTLKQLFDEVGDFDNLQLKTQQPLP